MTEHDYDILPSLIGYNLRRAQTAVFQDFSSTLADCKLTPGQFGVLVLIQANAGLNQTSLGRALGMLLRVQSEAQLQRCPIFHPPSKRAGMSSSYSMRSMNSRRL